MESYGYRFDTPDRTIAISGDTNPTQATIDACRGCDVFANPDLATLVFGIDILVLVPEGTPSMQIRSAAPGQLCEGALGWRAEP